MGAMERVEGLLDTSVVIASGGGAGPVLPSVAAVSTMTLAALHVGVLRARDPDERARRLRRLAQVEASFEPLPVDEDVARVYGAIMAEARERGLRPRVADVLIAATAAAHRLPVYTRDRDVDQLAGVDVVHA